MVPKLFQNLVFVVRINSNIAFKKTINGHFFWYHISKDIHLSLKLPDKDDSVNHRRVVLALWNVSMSAAGAIAEVLADLPHVGDQLTQQGLSEGVKVCVVSCGYNVTSPAHVCGPTVAIIVPS